MINLRSVYQYSEEQTKHLVMLLFVMLAGFLVLQSLFSPAVALAALFSVFIVVVAYLRPEFTLAGLALYLPFESLVLKFIPDNVYFFARFFSEGIIYLVAAVVLFRLLRGKIRLRRTQLDAPFVLFVLSLLAAAVVHFVPGTVAILGLRQILRFMMVFFLIVQLQPSKQFIKGLTVALFGVLLFQSALGIIQSGVHGALDQFLLASDERTLGAITLTTGVQEFWDPGSRVFATLGRYDRLGNFLYIFLLIATGFLFTLPEKAKKIQSLLWWVFALGIPTLILTYSRASWFAFLIGFLFIGLIIKRDKKVMAGLFVSIFVILGYLAVSGLTVGLLAEAPGQTLSERFFESFSYARWRGEYYGLGRTYWFVHTPLTVVASSPLIGWGPGQFGGGAVAALHNMNVYEQLALPFGVFGTEGYIDNNWFSLWAESGTIGMIFYLWMYLVLFRMALRTYHNSNDPYVKGLAIGFAAVMIAVAFNAFTSTVLEIRTVAFYLWLYAGFVYVLGQKEKNYETHSSQ